MVEKLTQKCLVLCQRQTLTWILFIRYTQGGRIDGDKTLF